MTKTPKINCNHDEILPVAQLVRRSVLRDKQAFMDFSPVYNEAFFTGLDNEIAEVSKLVPTDVLISENKKSTRDLYDYWENLRLVLNPLESYLKKAGDLLTAHPKDFLLSEIRDAIDKHDHAGVVDHAKAMLELVNRNKVVLEEKGLKLAAKTSLEKLVKDIEELSHEKRTDISDKETNTVNNVSEMRTLWSSISGICADGKIIFSGEPAKVKEYTLIHLLELVRQQNNGENPPEPPAGK